MNPVLSDWPVPKCNLDTGTSTTILEEKRVFNFEPNHLNTNLHSKNVTYKIKCSPITILHIILSQIVLVLFYYDLGFLFGNVSFLLLNIKLLNLITVFKVTVYFKLLI
jgi:hypothetical protein